MEATSITRLIGIIVLLAATQLRAASDVTVAVAANFHPTMRRLAIALEAELGFEVTVVAGSTGQLYAQIERGAPFDVFLSADAARPERLRAAGLTVGERTYAIGQLALWSADTALIDGRTLEGVLAQPWRHLAIANPVLAPYGQAAREALESLGSWRNLEPRIVYGQTVGQALAMAASGNAEFAIIALSLVLSDASSGAFITIPADMHTPIRQDAVLLRRAEGNPAARALFEFLFSEPARAIIAGDGYLLPR